MDLDNLKYSELQKLAKAAGIRANMKVEKLVKALKEHYNNQEQNDSDGQKTDSSTQPNSAEESHGSSNEDKDDTTKKKAVRGRKKGARGKAKKTSSKNHDKGEETSQTETLQNGSTSSKLPTPKNQMQKTPVLTKTAVSKKTPRSGTPHTSKTPVIIKPVSSKTLQSVTPKIVKPVLAKTPSSGPKNISAKKVITGKNTPAPGLFSPKGPVSRLASTSAARVTPGSGKKIATSATKENKKTLVSESSKRRSPRNHDADEKKQQDETSDKTTPGKTGGKRKRQDTFELEGPSLAATATPEAEKTTKRAKRSSGTGQQDNTTPSSPGVQDMIDSMSGEISSAERRSRLISAINKKVEGKAKSSPNTGPVTQIPRFAAFLAQKKREQKKPVTPGNKDWEKVHKKEFAKFDSIDVYLEKKRKRADEMTASVKKARTVLHEVQQAVAKLRNKRTPSMGKKSASQPFKPSVMSTKDMNLNFGATASKTKTASSRASTAPSRPFRPTVTSTKDMNLTFSALKTPVNEKRPAENKTPASSLKGAQSSTRKSMGTGQMSARKSLGVSAAHKSPNNTSPFKFTGNLSMSAAKSASKPVFDLKASLARPITWKPHTGRLKPVQEAYTSKPNEGEASTTKPAPATANRMDIFKSMVNRTQRTYSRHDRRVAAAAKRAEQKSNLQMKRRGITVSP